MCIETIAAIFRRNVSALCSDDRGGIVTMELLLVSSVVVTGLLTGLGSFQSSLQNEFVELGHKVKASTNIQQAVLPEVAKVATEKANAQSQFTEIFSIEDFEFVSED